MLIPQLVSGVSFLENKNKTPDKKEWLQSKKGYLPPEFLKVYRPVQLNLLPAMMQLMDSGKTVFKTVNDSKRGG